MAVDTLGKMTVWPRGRGKRFFIPLSPCLLVSLSLCTVGCDLLGQPKPADRPPPADQVMEFGALFKQNCAGCHGATGKLGPAPPLNDPLFRAIVPENELESIITKGRKDTLMPAFAAENGGTLTTAQIQVLVKEIKGIPYKLVQKDDSGKSLVEIVHDVDGIALTWGAPKELPKNVPPYRESSKSEGNKERGATVFGRACAVCHGEQGQGSKQGDGLSLTLNDPVFLSLISNQELRRYTITGRPDLGMPNYADARPGEPNFKPLTGEEVTDLVALLASWRRDKSGSGK
jgi:cytochrome c oxidase cbb3-type subunit III